MKKKNHIITTHSFLSLNTNPVPMILTSWNPHRYNPLLFSAGGTCDLLLTNRLRQKWQAITSMLMLHKIVIVMPLFQENAPVLALRKQAVRLERRRWQGTEGSFWPIASVQQHTRNRMLPVTGGFGRRLFCSCTSDENTALVSSLVAALGVPKAKDAGILCSLYKPPETVHQ